MTAATSYCLVHDPARREEIVIRLEDARANRATNTEKDL